MKKGISYIIPLIVALYTIAFFEVEIGGVQQTWGDVYDTYITGAHSDNIGSSDYHSVDYDLTFVPLPPFHYAGITPPVSEITFQELEHVKQLPPSRLFIRNCTWLI